VTFAKIKKHLAGRKYQMRKKSRFGYFPVSEQYTSKRYEDASKNWIKILKLCISHGREFFEGFRKSFWHCLF
jgi:hypothetical protein